MPRLRLDPTSPSGVSIAPVLAVPMAGRQNKANGYVVNKATGLIQAGTNVTFTGNGTPESPYVISASGGATGALLSANNLSDLASNATARTNLGLGSLATLNAASLTANVSGILPLANGGTNAATANGGLNNLLPTQTGNANKALVTDATNTSWQAVVTAASGSNQQLQYNDNGPFAGAAVYWDAGLGRLGVNTGAQGETLDVKGNFQVKDADTATKEYRFRTSGGNLDVDFSGADAFLSVFSAANYGGTQRNYLRLEAGAAIAHAIGTWIFSDGPYGGAKATIDGNTGLIYPVQAATASAPTYVKGAMYFDTTLNKLRIGGAAGWETVTST